MIHSPGFEEEFKSAKGVAYEMFGDCFFYNLKAEKYVIQMKEGSLKEKLKRKVRGGPSLGFKSAYFKNKVKEKPMQKMSEA